MPVTGFAADDLFVFRTIKFLSTNPDNKWANSYEFQATTTGDTALLEAAAQALVLFEATLSQNTVLFDRVLVSTWEEDSKPYNPETFMSIPQSTGGLVGAVGDQLSLDKCLSLARVPVSGRYGHVFLRGVLNEADTSAPAGKTILNDRAGIQSNVDAAMADSELEVFLGTSSGGALRMVMVNKAGTQVRPVTTLNVQGVATLPTDHAWFNRTPLLSP